MMRARLTSRANLTIACLAFGVLTLPTSALAQPGAKYHLATITFTDAPPSSSVYPAEPVRLTGDGQPYTNATITLAPAGTLALNLAKSSRRLRITLKDGVAVTGPLPPGTGPDQDGVTYVAGTELSVYGVRSITPGASAVREMGIVVDEIKRGYRLKFHPNAQDVGTMVCVSRSSSGTSWTISSLSSGEFCGTSGDQVGGETVRLVDQRTSASVQLGYYVMPFSFQVDCPTCTP